MLKYFLILLTIFSLGCISVASPPVFPTNRHLHYYLHLDPAFTLLEQELIKKGATSWTTHTHGFITWDYLSYPEFNPNNLEDDLRLPTENDQNCSHHVLIVKVLSTDPMITHAEEILKEHILGYAFPPREQCDKGSILLVMDRIIDRESLRIVATHELGHILLLKHRERSIMERRGFMTDDVNDTDLQQLCEVQDCR